MEQAKQRFVILSKAKDLGTECHVKEIPRFSLALPLRYLSAARNDSDSVNRTMDPRDKHEDLSKFRRHSDLIRMSTTSFGFTLVELAIALMVIGLLIGGVLKGRELIENARVTATIRQIKAFDTAALIFRNTYNALPGDIKRPNRIPNCNTEDDAICGIGGNGNGKIGHHNDPNPTEEKYNFFPQLTKAGMIQGPEGGTADDMTNAGLYASSAAEENARFFPKMPYESIHSVQTEYKTYAGAPLINGHIYLIYEIPSIAQASIDMKMDDGLPCKGFIAIHDTGTCSTETDEYDTATMTDALAITAEF